jgi:putative RNA 2'-phosphotransferase
VPTVNRKKNCERLRKLLVYVLEQRPDEFGLVPDAQGFLRMKDLLTAITEEPGWGYVRRSDILEVLAASGETFFVTEEDRIKTVNPDAVSAPGTAAEPPKLLFHCIRRKACHVVYTEGIRPSGHTPVILAVSEALAERMGKRRDPAPVLLTVHARKAFDAGIRFFRHGELLYSTACLPVDFFAGPPLPLERKKEPPKRQDEPPPEEMAGSVVFDPHRTRALNRPRRTGKGHKKEVGWKQDVRQLRRLRKKEGRIRDET